MSRAAVGRLTDGLTCPLPQTGWLGLPRFDGQGSWSGYLCDAFLVGGSLELVGCHVAERAVQPGAVVLMRVIVSSMLS
jgi:hypothetical protein